MPDAGGPTCVKNRGMDDASPGRSRTERSRRSRSVWILTLLVSGTLLGLGLSWAQPQATLWHFWGVTQLLPVFYLALSVWAAWPLPGEDDE